MENQIEIVETNIWLRKTYKFLFKQKWNILLSGIFFAALGVLIIWWIGPIYTAQMSFVSENDKSSKAGSYASIAAQFGIDIGLGGGGAFEGENLIEFFKSRRLIDQTLLSPSGMDDKLIIDWYIENNNLKNKWKRKDESVLGINFFKDLNNNYTRKHDSLLNLVADEIIKKRLDIDKKDKKIDFIFLKIESNNQEFGKIFIETLANNAIKYYSEYKTKKSKQNVDLLQRQTDSVREELYGKMGQVAQQNDLNINPLKQQLKVPAQKIQSNLQVNATVYSELVKNLELAKLTLLKETPLIQIIDKPRLPLKNQIISYKVAIALFFSIGVFIFSALKVFLFWKKQSFCQS